MPDRGWNVDHVIVTLLFTSTYVKNLYECGNIRECDVKRKLYIDISGSNFYNNERVKNNCR